MRDDVLELLVRIASDRPLSDDLRRRAVEILGELLRTSEDVSVAPTPEAAGAVALGTAASTRRLVYVHGICSHTAGFSDPWWEALRPFVPGVFGAGTLGQQRREVLWSNLVNQASATLAAAVAGGDVQHAMLAEQSRALAASEIKETLRDRADREQMTAAAAQSADDVTGAAFDEQVMGGISIPGLNCIDDFSIYLTSNTVRQQIINRFIDVVRPLFQSGEQIDVISHSWGTVVAYEGLRQLEDEGHTSPLVHCFFTVGSALSIGAVKSRLRPANMDGRKPGSVRKWVNLDAKGDLVGGPLKNRPYQVDADFVNLSPTGCQSFLSVVNPQCAHASYFRPSNRVVNRDIFAAFINAG